MSILNISKGRTLLIVLSIFLFLNSHSQQLQLFTNVQGMSQVYNLAFDNEGNVYAAGIASGNAAVVKLDSTGNEIWRNDLVVAMMSNRIAIAQEVFVNDSGQVFVSCSREVGKGTVARLDKNDGSIVWRYDGVRGFSSTNSQVLFYSRILASNSNVLYANGAKTSDQNQKTHIYIFDNETGAIIQNSRSSAMTISGYRTLVFDSILYAQSFDNSDSTFNGIHSISTSGEESFLSVEEQPSLLNLIGLHNNKFYGIRNDDNPDGPGSSPTLVQIDSVTGDIISEISFRTSVDTVTKGGAGLSAMTDEYGILVSGAASSYPGFSRAYKWIAQVHPQTAEVVWDTLIDTWGEYAYDHLFSNGKRHFLTGRANTIHELTVPKIGWTPSSTERVTEKKRSKIYPNPASNVLHLDIHNPQSKVMIYTIEGKLIEETVGDQKKLDISGYPSGMYFVSVIEPNNKIETFKIVKK